MQSQGKAVRISSPGGNGNNITIRNNEIKGGQDFMWMNATVGLIVENNYVHELFGGEESHGDGFQWSSQSVGGATMIFRGNYFDLRGTASANDILFVASASYNAIYMENNFFAPFGSFTLVLVCQRRLLCHAEQHLLQRISFASV